MDEISVPSTFLLFKKPWQTVILLQILWTFLHTRTFYNPIHIVWTFYSYGHFTLWSFFDSSNLYGHFNTMDNLQYGFFTHRSQIHPIFSYFGHFSFVISFPFFFPSFPSCQQRLRNVFIFS